MKKTPLNLVLILWSFQFVISQPKDTIQIKPENIKIDNLNFGNHDYLVYSKSLANDSITGLMIWNRKVSKDNFNNQEVIKVEQLWQEKERTFHKATSLCDTKDFTPLHQKYWMITKDSIITDFANKKMKLSVKAREKVTDRVYGLMQDAFKSATEQYILNWHLDLEVFSTLPFKEYVVFAINFYDPGSRPPRLVYYTVEGTEFLESVAGNNIECWIMTKSNRNSSEKFWISKKTNDVLRMEQLSKNNLRVKIKLTL